MDKEKIWEIKSIGIVEPVKPKAEYWVALNVTVEHPQGYAAVCTDEGCVAYFEDSDHAHYFAKWLEGGSRW